MKKTPAVHVIGLFVSVLLVAQSAFADAAADLKQAEGLYEAGKYAEAERIYQKVLQNESGSPEMVYQAGKMLPRIYLATDRLPQAQEAVLQLLANSASHEWLPHGVHEIIEQAKQWKKTPQARQICQNILTAQPEHPQAVWLKMGIVIADVYAGNNQGVEVGVQEIIARCSADRWAGEALAQIGWAYDKLGQYEKARPVYEYVVDHWPDKSRVIYAHTALVRGCIRLKDKQAAQTRLQQLVSQYARDTHLSNVLNEIARGYREAQMYQEAKAVCQYVLDHFPDSDQRIWAQRDLVLCDVGLGDQDAAQAGVQKLVTNYTKDGNLPYVLNEVARTYREARRYEQAKPISQFILDHYPDSDQRIWADRDILLCDVRLDNQEAARAALQNLISRYAENGYLPYMLVEISGQYRHVRMFSQARSASRYVLDRHPESDQCLWAQRDIVLSDLELHDLETADAESQRLVSRFAKRPDAFWAVSEVAEANSRLGRHEQARDLFRFNVTNYPASDDTIWSLRGFVNESIALNDNAGIEAGIKRLLSEYSTSKNLPMAVLHVGRTLCNADRPQAAELFQYVIEKHPDHQQALFAKVCLGHVYVRQGQDGQAEALYQRILTDYANDPHVGEAIDLMAEAYYDRAAAQQGSRTREAIQDPTGPRPSVPTLSDSARADRAKAIEKWEIIIRKLPPNPRDTPRAYHLAGESYRQLGQLGRTLEYYQKVVETWPTYDLAWHLQFMIARFYRDLVRSGQVEAAQANPKIQAALTAVVQKYPNCPAMKAARDWLGQIARVQEGDQR